MSDGSKLGQLLWDEDDPSGLRWGRMFWNQVKKYREKKLEKKKKKMRVAGMFLNEGEKENKIEGGGDRDRTTCEEEKNRKKKMKCMDKMK